MLILTQSWFHIVSILVIFSLGDQQFYLIPDSDYHVR